MEEPPMLELTTGALSFFRLKVENREYTLTVTNGCDAQEALYMLDRFKEEVSKFITDPEEKLVEPKQEENEEAKV